MNKRQKFFKLLESLKGKDDSLIEFVKQGFKVCMESQVEIYDYTSNNGSFENFHMGVYVNKEFLKEHPFLIEPFNNAIKTIKNNPELNKTYMDGSDIFEYLAVELKADIELNGNWSGSFHSAGPTGPAEGPEFNYEGIDVDNLQITFTVEGEPLVEIPLDDVSRKWAENKIEQEITNNERVIQELEGEGPTPPRGFSTTYRGPV